MTLWLALTALIAFVCGLLAIPFLRRLAPAATGEDRALRFAADQITELERDVARGVMSEADAADGRAEIERRLLKAHKAAAQAPHDPSPRFRLLGLGIVLGWVVLGSAALYGVVGRPELAAIRTLPAALGSKSAPAPNAQAKLQSVGDAITALAARLDADPTDAEGWRMLGWSYFQTEDYAKSVAAYQKAIALDDSKPVIFSVLGEAMVRKDGGAVGPDAVAAFDKALAGDPTDPRARFFKGLALEQQGDGEGALALWRDILGQAPADADWAPGLRLRVAQLAERLGKAAPEASAAAAVPAMPAAPGPTAADVAAAGQMSAAERSDMIRGMVARLASRLEDDPSDTDGWVRLVRSYVVLGDMGAARAAVERARALAKPEAVDRIVAEARGLGVE